MPLYRPKLKKKRYFGVLILKARFIIYCFILVGVIVFGLTRDHFSIKQVKVDDEAPAGDYQNFIIRQVINRNIFIFWLLGLRKLHDSLLARYPVIKEAKFQPIRLEFGNIEVRVKILLRSEVGLYCYDKECYFFDETGYIFKRSDQQLERNLPLLILQDFGSQPYGIKRQIRIDLVQDLIAIKHFFDNLDLKVRSVEFTAIDDYKILLINYDAYFLIEKENFANNLLNLEVFLTKKLNDDVHYLEKVVYLDARYQDKVFELLK